MDSGLGWEDLQGQSSSWNSGSGWSFEVIDFQEGVRVGPRVLGCPEGAAQLGQRSQASLGSWLPAGLPVEWQRKSLRAGLDGPLSPNFLCGGLQNSSQPPQEWLPASPPS